MKTLKACLLAALAFVALAPGDSVARARSPRGAMRALPEPDTPGEAPPWMAPATPAFKAGDAPYGAAPETPAAGFAPLSVVQDGMAYTPSAIAPSVGAVDAGRPNAPDPTRKPASAAQKLLQSMGIKGFGSLPEPATWALMLIGFAMIGGALRGFILANRRLARLRAEDDAER